MFRKLNNCSVQALTRLLIFLSLFPFACKNAPSNPENTIYHWRSRFNPNSYEKKFLIQNHIQTIYFKYFDVDLVNGQILPIASLQVTPSQLKNYNVIPVVFITQAALNNMTDSLVPVMAKKISSRIIDLNSKFQLATVKEWQIDCDWTQASRQTYFKLLGEIRNYGKENQAEISATLRLYPFKYRSKMGIPPVDRVMLMCYNMGNLKNPNVNNSIIDPQEMKKYLSVHQVYPLPLDAALPLFSWYVWYRDREYKGLIYPSDAERISCLSRKANKLYFTKDTVFNGRGFLRGDWLREEETTVEDLLEAKKLLQHLPQQIRRFALFHLDSLILNKYSNNALAEILSGPR